jgi:hypothetical protein
VYFYRGFNGPIKTRVDDRAENMKALKAALKKDGAEYFPDVEYYVIYKLDAVSGYEEVALIKKA